MRTQITKRDEVELANAGLKPQNVASVFNLYGTRIIRTVDDQLLIEGKGLIEAREACAPVLVSRELTGRSTQVRMGDVEIGSPVRPIPIMAGPCGIESEAQLARIARGVREAGASVLRGGAFKPRTSPYSFQGLGKEGLEILKRIGDAEGMPVVSEIVSELDVALFMNAGIDMAQVGARNAQNYALLRALGESEIPVLLKRGPSSTVKEWLFAAEYLLSNGNGQVILCERGIVTHEDSTRYTLDLGGMSVAKSMTHLPVGADPSHAAGKARIVGPNALAAAGAGADFVLIEVHDDPKSALSDAEQQLSIREFSELARGIRRVAMAFNPRKFDDRASIESIVSEV